MGSPLNIDFAPASRYPTRQAQQSVQLGLGVVCELSEEFAKLLRTLAGSHRLRGRRNTSPLTTSFRGISPRANTVRDAALQVCHRSTHAYSSYHAHISRITDIDSQTQTNTGPLLSDFCYCNKPWARARNCIEAPASESDHRHNDISLNCLWYHIMDDSDNRHRPTQPN
jgi:hypothetical protein